MLSNVVRRLLVGLSIVAVLFTPMTVRAQDVVAEPDTYDFYTVYIGQSETMTGSLHNANGGTVAITHWEWTYNPLAAFEVTSGLILPAPIGSGESVDYQVTFTPPDFSFWNARLVFYTDSATTPSVEVQFWGFGDYDPGLPNISVWPTALDFGTVSIGDDGSQTTTITNSGGGELIVSLSITGSPDFGFASGTPSDFTLTGGQAQDVVLLYSPSDIGDDAGNLVIAHNDPDLMDDITVPLSGTGLPVAADCDLSVSPSTLDFGAVIIGKTSTMEITLNNTGSGDCTVYGLDFTGSSEFTPNSATPAIPFQVLAGGPTVTVRVDYAPSDAGDDAGALSVGSDDPDTPAQSVSLSGSGVFSFVDLDLGKLHASHRVSLSSARAVRLWTRIRNNGLDEGDRLIRLTGVQGGDTVYNHSRLVGDPVGRGGTRIDFPSYVPDAAGLIVWTVVLFDDDPDDDTATATTTVVP